MADHKIASLTWHIFDEQIPVAVSHLPLVQLGRAILL
jgi:hypothetical protein